MVKVIATDLDGTLLKPKKKFTLVDKENQKFIKEFYGDIVLCSGRKAAFCAKICNKLKIEHNFIALNGAIIVKDGNVIYRQSMKKTMVENMLYFLNEQYDNFEFLIYDKYDKIYCYSPKKKSTVKRKYFKSFIKNVRLCEKIIVNNALVGKYLNDDTEVYKVLIYTDNPEELTKILKEKYKEHFTFYPTKHSIEVSPIGVSKGASLKYLIETTKVKKDEVFVVGDNSNDEPMFEMFPNSFLITDKCKNITIKTKYKIDKFSDLKKYTKLNGNFH